MAPNHSNTARSQTARATRQLRAMLTRDPAWVREAQRLRHDVFAAEYGASFGSSEPGIDADPFDPFCEHLMVVDHYNGQLVATTRLLHQDDAQAAGGFYSESEFDLSNLYTLPGKIVEMGRTCVHPDYQNGATMAVLWAGLAEYLKTLDIGFLIGCASIHIQDSGQRA
ncbi:MAG: GNAT family N-acetyltransferase, partial [Gammaproteobacteria bacterium]|nr:GNAT family N-acetyltransferase [Gammaproteobacteria bacterium]